MQKANLTTELLSVLYYIRLTGHEENGRGKSILLHNKTQWLLYGFTLRFNSIYKCIRWYTHIICTIIIITIIKNKCCIIKYIHTIIRN